MQKTEELLKETFNDEIVEALIDKVQQAYKGNFDCYAPEIGHDAMTFGLMIYKSKVHFLSQLADEIDDVKIIQKAPSFCMRIGPYRLATYCAGRSGDADISTSFPLNRTRAPGLAESNQAQMSFYFAEDPEPDDSDCREIILNDIGNSTDGLCKLFLGVPVDTTPDGRVSKWGTTLVIWANDMEKPLSATPPIEDAPPVEEVAPPTIVPKTVEKKKEQQ